MWRAWLSALRLICPNASTSAAAAAATTTNDNFRIAFHKLHPVQWYVAHGSQQPESSGEVGSTLLNNGVDQPACQRDRVGGHIDHVRKAGQKPTTNELDPRTTDPEPQRKFRRAFAWAKLENPFRNTSGDRSLKGQ